MARPNLHRAELSERDLPGFTCRRARIGDQLGTEKIGMSLWEVPPGEGAYPYHWHMAEEELLVVLEGTASLRTPAGWEELEAGDVVAFPVGAEGAHQIVNRSDETVRFLAFSNQAPEIVFQVDSGKVGVLERDPATEGMPLWFHVGDAVHYMEGVPPP